MTSTDGGFFLLPDYISQYNKSIIFLSDSSSFVYINFGSALNPITPPMLYELNIQTYSYSSGSYGNGLGYYGRAYVLYNGSGTSLIITQDDLTGIALAETGTGVLRIDISGATTSGAVVSFFPTIKNMIRSSIITNSTSPYVLQSYDISMYNKSILATSYTNGYVYVNMANSGYNMGVECSYEVTAATIVGGGSYGCATIAINTLSGGDGVVSVITQASSGMTFLSDSTFLLRIDVGISGIPVYISFNRITNTPGNSLSGGNVNTYSYNRSYYNIIQATGIPFTTDSGSDVYIKMASTSETKMNIPTGNDFFLYKCLASTSVTNLIVSFYVLVSAWNISVLMSARTNSNINVTVNTSTFVVQIATTAVGQIVTCSFQRMIDTTNAIAAPVYY